MSQAPKRSTCRSKWFIRIFSFLQKNVPQHFNISSLNELRLLPFLKSFHSQKIAGQPRRKKNRRNKGWVDGILSSRRPFEFSSTSLIFFSPLSSLTPGLSVSPPGLHVFIHRLWGSWMSSTQCTNMQPAELGFRGDLFSSCAGLSYIHGNQPVQSQRPARLESNKTARQNPLWISC